MIYIISKMGNAGTPQYLNALTTVIDPDGSEVITGALWIDNKNIDGQCVLVYSSEDKKNAVMSALRNLGETPFFSFA